MPRKRQVALNEATRRQIKQTASHLMAEHGTAGLSLRAIARELGLSAPALYHYFPSLDDLITALIVDAFTAHADAARQARDAATGASYTAQLFAIACAYRAWALAHPIDFQLIYGNPIPGYEAPASVTVPAARLLAEVVLETIQAALASGELVIRPPYRDVPPGVAAHMQARFGLPAGSDALDGFHLLTHIWGLMHGLTMLEVHHHLAPVVGDTEAFYTQALRNQFQVIGLADG